MGYKLGNNMVNNKEKVIKELYNITETGYYNNLNEFITHSFDDEPAYIWKDETKHWYKDGEYHREGDLPAFEHLDGSKSYWKNGKRHRDIENLPAIIWSDGGKLWYDHGIQYWYIENRRYNTLEEVYKKYGNQRIQINVDICQILTDMNIEFIILNMLNTFYEYLILDDIHRNEVILRYG